MFGNRSRTLWLDFTTGLLALTALAACGLATPLGSEGGVNTVAEVADAFGRMPGFCDEVDVDLDWSTLAGSSDADEVSCKDDGTQYVAVIFDSGLKETWCEEKKTDPNSAGFFEDVGLFGKAWFGITFGPNFSINDFDDLEVMQDMLGGEIITGTQWCS